ncbi:MAG: ABC transporter permease [Acidimicrobiia bacterium]|nr:ABC transporter permease [Acidimicrobiia bacterium]
MGTAAVDNAMQWMVLIPLFALYTFAPSPTAVYLPILLVILVAFTTGLSLSLAALVVYVRDLRRIVPVLLQIGLFATPVGYGLDKYPESLVRWYAFFNPLVGVIDGYRRCVLYDQAPQWDLVGLGAITAFGMLIFGFVTFKKLEPGIADVA